MPGIGKKSAQRISYYLLSREREQARHLANIITQAMDKVGHCQQCRTFTEEPVCHICSNPKRDQSLLCVVENPADRDAIEATSYRGLYFILMGHLSPIKGINPKDLGLDDLFHQLLKERPIKEVIIATNTTIEGEATAHYIHDVVKAYQKVVSRIAHGIPMGGELEYADPNTIAYAIDGRSQF